MTNESEIQTQTSDGNKTAGLLTPKERRVCEGVAASGAAPWNQRAQALIAVNQGDSLALAAESTGLRENQVRYWLNALRRKRTDIFPEQVLKELEVDSAESTSEMPEEDAAAAERAGKTKKNKKDKKNKKSKGKPAKSAKKTKKGKKSKNKKGKKKKK